MDDRQRLNQFRRELDRLEGLDETLYERLSDELVRTHQPFGQGAGGRLRIVMFDSKLYDRRAFDAHNHGRFDIEYMSPSLSSQTVPAIRNSRVVCIFVNDQCDAEIVEHLARQGVELVALRCAGYNNVDLEACREHGVSVVRVPDYSPNAVAEHSVALMLMLNRRLHQAYQRNRAGQFVLEGLTGFDMCGKVIGVVGTGRIGRCLIDILLGFGCRIVACDKYPAPELAGRPNVQYADLPSLLEQSDIVSLHVPLLPDTHHLIDGRAIDTMKPGAMLINTSRGGLVDTRALIGGLKSGKIGAAGLDVYEEEAGVFFHDLSDRVLTDDVLARLLTFNNVVVTSHQAFLTHEALAKIAETTLSSVAEFADGKRGDALTWRVAVSG